MPSLLPLSWRLLLCSTLGGLVGWGMEAGWPEMGVLVGVGLGTTVALLWWRSGCTTMEVWPTVDSVSPSHQSPKGSQDHAKEQIEDAHEPG